MLTFLFLLLVLIPASTQSADSSAKVAQRIDCRLVLSIDMSLDDRWERTAGETGVGVPETSSVVKGQYFAAYLFLTHYTENKQGIVGINYDIKIAKPDGKPYHAEDNLKAWSGPGGGVQGVLLSDTTLRLCFDPEDPLGTYVVAVSVRDQNNGSSTTAKSSIELVEYAEGKGFADKTAFDSWLQGYCESPEPQRAIPAIMALDHIGVSKESDAFRPVSAFFLEVLQSNSWLFPRLLSKFDGENAVTRRVILWLLSHSTFDSKVFIGKLKGDDREAWKQISKKTPRPDPLHDPITEAEQLDQLWGNFFASGKFAPIQRLCQALSPEETGAIVKGPLQSVLKDSAASSIRSAADDHPLVKAYCQRIPASETTPPGVRKALEKALGS